MANTTITGNISEPKLEFGGPQNKARLTFSIAENHARFDKEQQEWKQIGTTWYRVTMWEQYAEMAAELLQKGDRVIAEGRSETRAYTTTDGTEGSSFELHVNNIGKVIPKRAPRPQSAPQPQQPAADPWAAQQPAQPQSQGWDTPATQPAAWDQQGDQGPIPF